MKTYVLAVANQKGGVGKTTTAVNLSACLVERKQRVLLVDLDPQANATSGLGEEKTPGRSVYAALLDGGDLRPLVRATAYRRFDLVPAEVDLAGAEVDLAAAPHHLHRFRRLLEPLLDEGAYDYVVIDCPPSLGVLTANALAAAHGVLITLQCEYYSLEGLSTITGVIRMLRDSGANPALDIEGILMTMYDRRTRLARQVVREVVDHFGDKVYETLIPRTVRLSEAPSYGQPVIIYDKHSTGAAAYRLLAREFLKRRQAAATPGTAPEGAAAGPPAAPAAVDAAAAATPESGGDRRAGPEAGG